MTPTQQQIAQQRATLLAERERDEADLRARLDQVEQALAARRAHDAQILALRTPGTYELWRWPDSQPFTVTITPRDAWWANRLPAWMAEWVWRTNGHYDAWVILRPMLQTVGVLLGIAGFLLWLTLLGWLGIGLGDCPRCD